MMTENIMGLKTGLEDNRKEQDVKDSKLTRTFDIAEVNTDQKIEGVKIKVKTCVSEIECLDGKLK